MTTVVLNLPYLCDGNAEDWGKDETVIPIGYRDGTLLIIDVTNPHSPGKVIGMMEPFLLSNFSVSYPKLLGRSLICWEHLVGIRD